MIALIIDGDRKFSSLCAAALKKNGIGSDTAGDFVSGLELALSDVYDFAVTDTTLKKGSGEELIERIRAAGLRMPIIVVSSDNTSAKIIKCLDSGADEYILKPVPTEELMAKIRAVLRRPRTYSDVGVLSAADVCLSVGTYELIGSKGRAVLGLKEMCFAELLFRAGRNIVTKDDMILKVWGFDSDAGYNNIECYISVLRKKLSAVSDMLKIRTVRGIGYRLVAENQTDNRKQTEKE